MMDQVQPDCVLVGRKNTSSGLQAKTGAKWECNRMQAEETYVLNADTGKMDQKTVMFGVNKAESVNPLYRPR